MSDIFNFPRQQLPFKSKTKEWRKRCVSWADSKTFFNYSPVRNSVVKKKILYDLVNGKLHMEDLVSVINPDNIQASYITEKIEHYPIINSKLQVLRGEEYKRVFDCRAIVTNPNAISEIEIEKKEQLLASLQQAISDESASEEQFNQEIQKISDFYAYEWQDFREIRANSVINHYMKEHNMPLMFNNGFMDALVSGEEIYKCDIVGGEPVIERVNPLKIRVFKSGYSNRIEDADIIIIEDYWSPGRVIDTFYDVLTKKDLDYIETMPDNVGTGHSDSMGNIDERYSFVHRSFVDDSFNNSGFYFSAADLFGDTAMTTLLPYDIAGNLRVLQVYWKSRRKIKKVKHYDPDTGEELFDFYPETYICNKDLGEEEEIFWINEAWEGTKIGQDIYVNMRPRPVQYNRLSNPSRCHFGIIGSVYNLNENRPFSMVDMMRKYNYLYDVIYDKLNKLIARNYGKIIQLDIAKVPKGWDIDKWLYFAKVNGVAVSDSFKEGNSGAAMGKLAGGLNNAQSGVIDADWGNNIQQYINLLSFIKMEMSEAVGISPQREGQISNRETVGGVERATLQSSHITEWLFAIHDDVKKRAVECFVETAKIAFKGRTKKFQYILPDLTTKVITLDGDEFAEADYGIIIDNSNGSQKLNQQMETLAQAALQNQTLSFSTIMKIYSSCSLAEKQRMVENDERRIREQAQQTQQQEMQMQQQQMQAQQQSEMMKMEQENLLNERDNETRILIAQINAQSKLESQDTDKDGIVEPMSEEAREKLNESVRQFNEKIALEREKLSEQKKKNSTDASLKRMQINKKISNTSK